jgi:hypothetical protein
MPCLKLCFRAQPQAGCCPVRAELRQYSKYCFMSFSFRNQPFLRYRFMFSRTSASLISGLIVVSSESP